MKLNSELDNHPDLNVLVSHFTRVFFLSLSNSRFSEQLRLLQFVLSLFILNVRARGKLKEFSIQIPSSLSYEVSVQPFKAYRSRDAPTV